MNLRTNKKIIPALQTLGIVGLIFFAMAFACKDDTGGGGTNTGGGRKTQTTKGGGKCSTEEEFKNLLIEQFSSTFNERDGKFKNTEVEFQTFDIGEPFRYQNSYPLVDAEPAYPVTTSYTKRDHLNEKSFPRIYEVRATDNRYVFYTDHTGKCVFALESGGTSESKSIPLDQ